MKILWCLVLWWWCILCNKYKCHNLMWLYVEYKKWNAFEKFNLGARYLPRQHTLKSYFKFIGLLCVSSTGCEAQTKRINVCVRVYYSVENASLNFVCVHVNVCYCIRSLIIWFKSTLMYQELKCKFSYNLNCRHKPFMLLWNSKTAVEQVEYFQSWSVKNCC